MATSVVPTNGSIAFLFPGQGSQTVGMGKDLAETYPVAKQTFDEADDSLGYKISKLCFEGPEDQLRLTEITQPADPDCLSGRISRSKRKRYQARVRRGTQPRRVFCSRCGGDHFVSRRSADGEESRQVHARGGSSGSGSHGRHSWHESRRGDLPLCNEAAQDEVCEPANINSSEQIVISGHAAAVERAVKLAETRGAKRAILLPVSAPFHCSLMRPAQERLIPDLKEVIFQKSRVPVICNVDAASHYEPAKSRDALVRQVTGSVKWDQSIRLLISSGVQTFVEVGPGKVLSGLMRQIDRSKNALNVGDEASLQRALKNFSAVSA